MARSNSKDRKMRNVEASIDRISDLPDPILCKIVSLLSTKNAVATNILSTRWKNLFPFGVSPISLTFDDTDFLRHKASDLRFFLRVFDEPLGKLSDSFAHFRDFVDKLLHHTLVDNMSCVESMHLSCQKYHGIDKIVSWVTAALQLKVRTLVLKLTLVDSGALFNSLNGCATLLSLSLSLNLSEKTRLCVPDNFSLPNLNKLQLSGMQFDDSDDDGNYDGDSINKILNACPVLEDLSLVGCTFYLSEVIFIRSTLLKCFTIKSSKYTGCSFDIDAPNLQRLMFRCSSTRKHCVSEFKSLRTAHIDTRTSTLTGEKAMDMGIYYDEDADCYVIDGILQLVSACSSTTSLHLAGRTISALCDPSVRLPEFRNLTWLRLGSVRSNGWALLARLLHSSPNLEKLVFEEEFMEKKYVDDERGYTDFENLVSVPPMCLELHVKQIEFRVFNWKDEESKLLAYFLKNGEVLEKVILRCLPSVMNILTRFTSDPKIILEAR